jgi:hypothetical protein
MLNFMEIINHDTNQIKVVDELTDELFDQGYRFLQYVSNSEVDILEINALREEELLIRMAGSSSDPYYDINTDELNSDSYYIQPIEIY